ncbi:hypothetical protein EJ02DRAFT_466349 [Clathrospora elynae]|uniref:Uncharacterized protein n=1 Tax=Clathrospora elynae TaxID=706981 RepID=A0A6A5SPF4_9PLEO|nr:hypothetical protein EJ02DRAFT_466349 [Clathrospora elynae]
MQNTYRRAKSDSAPPRGAGWKQDSGPGQRRDVPQHDRSTDDTARTLWQRTPAPFGGLQDWGPCHLTKENFRRRDRVRVTARWRKDTGEDTLSLGRTRHSICDAVDVKGNFLGTHS